MIKHQGHLYLLVTDQGFLQEGGVVWESLHNVEGDGNFCDSDFRLCRPAPPTAVGVLTDRRRCVPQDYLVAVSLQQAGGGAGGGAPAPLSDLELARQLQQEEYQQQQGAGPAAHQVTTASTLKVKGQGMQQSDETSRFFFFFFFSTGQRSGVTAQQEERQRLRLCPAVGPSSSSSSLA
uniref:Ubiquitin carboxyl-terminal hydrolase n=1 Tax=Salarias fasciatus TaxID=181472 RepID=A0A672G5N2_SALFA